MTANEWLTLIFVAMSFLCGYYMGKARGMKETLRAFVAGVMQVSPPNKKED